MLETIELQRRFPNGREAFEPLNIKVPKGGILGVLGTSGCGKSTLLRVLTGLDPASTGELLLDGKPIRGINPAINLVFQEPRLLPWRRVADNVAFGLFPRHRSRADTDQGVQEALRRVGLEGFARHYPKECSGGMAQRVALARALVRTPEVLLLDEPFSALDAFIRMQLQDVLLDIHRQSQATMVLVTHDIDEALYLCDRILVLRGQPGKLVRDIHLDQPRPRHRGDSALGRVKEDILAVLNLAAISDDTVEYHI